jgi:hypothetical protein
VFKEKGFNVKKMGDELTQFSHPKIPFLIEVVL